VAFGLYTVIVGVFILSVTNYIFPKLSRMATSEDEVGLKRTEGESMHAAAYIVIPMAAGLMSLSGEVISFIYGGGRFDDFSIRITSRALFWMTPGMLGYAAQAVLCRVYFARQKGAVLSSPGRFPSR
jgi:putative peptidoglycan lipid II flippase